jgi:glycosyltransferase involved in cell wall biosynthesis
MACGTPVISSDLSAMPEILGDAPLYFDPYDIKSSTKAMTKITFDAELRSELSKKGLEQVKKYSWDKTGEGTLEVYKEVFDS